MSGETLSNGTVTGVVGTAIGTAIGAVGAYFARKHTSRSQKAQDFDTVVEGFSKLVSDLRDECERLGSRVDELQEGVSILTGHIGSLEGIMRERGIPVPERPTVKNRHPS